LDCGFVYIAFDWGVGTVDWGVVAAENWKFSEGLGIRDWELGECCALFAR